MARLFQGFEQGIGCRLGHRFGLLHHHHGPAGFQRRARQKPAELADLLQADLGQGFLAQAPLFGLSGCDALAFFQIGGLHPDQIGMVALLEAPAQVEIGLGATSAEALEKTAGRQRTPHTIGPGKQISRSQALLIQSRSKQLEGLLLPFDSGKQRLTHEANSKPSRTSCCTC